MDGASSSSSDATDHVVDSHHHRQHHQHHHCHVPQPQWEQFAIMRDYTYTHTQPQWQDVQRGTADDNFTPLCSTSSPLPASATAPLRWTPAVVRPPPLEDRRVCMTCLQLKQSCTCKTCFVCHSTFLKNRHHCRRCWHAVCSGCWGYKHYVHMLGRPMVVCDRCSVSWALANVLKRDEAGLLWGLYALRIAAEMPRLCISPDCRIFTRRLTCYGCGLPTVSTQPHMSRVVRANGTSNAVLDMINVLDMEQLSLRSMVVNGMTAADVERIFRRYFHNYEEVLAFRAVPTAKAAQRILLANVAAAIAYEYIGAPNITLDLSDIPYAQVLQVVVSRERYTVLEAPGRVKFIAFPGTHNWRTRWVDMRFSQVQETVWTKPHDGVRVNAQTPSSPPVALCGGVRKTWEYRVHGGFAQEAQDVDLPLDALLDDVRHGGYTLVLCGHSLGGAIAQYLTLQLLHRAAALFASTDPLAEPRLTCVTFGAPLLGNYELADHVQSCGWSHLFHNFIYRSDVVPRLSCIDELAWDAQSRLTYSFTSVLTAAQKWWRGKSNAHQGSSSSNNNSSDDCRSEAVFAEATAADAAASPVSITEDVGVADVGTGARRHRTLPSLLSTAAKTTAALSVGLTGGASEATLVTAADGGMSDMPTEASVTESEAAAAEEARLAALMDTAIRTSRDLLEDEEREEKPPHSVHGDAGDGDNAGARPPVRDVDVEAALSVFARRRSGVNASAEASRMKRPRTHNCHNGASVSDMEREGKELRERCICAGDTATATAGETAPTLSYSDCPDHCTPPPPTSSSALSPAAPTVTASADVTADVVIPARRMHRRFTCFGRFHFVQYGSYGYVSTDDSETAFGILKHGCGESTVLRDHSVAAYNRGLMIHLYRNLD